MSEPALFVADGDAFVPTDHSRGPWDPEALHGGPVAALLARAVDQHEVDPDHPVRVARMTLELLRPVPVKPLSLVTRTVRPGRKVQLVETTIAADEQPLSRMLALRIRSDSIEVPDGAPGEVPPPVESATKQGLGRDWGWPGFHNAVELRYVKGAMGEPGPATVWIRLNVPVLEGEAPTPLIRLAAASDFGNGVSSHLAWDTHLFINPDLTIYVNRPPEGEWVCLDAFTYYGPDGIALAESALYDTRGRIGRAVQALLVDRR